MLFYGYCVFILVLFFLCKNEQNVNKLINPVSLAANQAKMSRSQKRLIYIDNWSNQTHHLRIEF
jgi:hypothetical protein